MKKLSLFGFLLILVCQLSAQRVSENQATQVCQRFLMDKNHAAEGDNIKLAEVYTQGSGEEALYLFQLPTGFVLVSASRTTPPILAYSFENNFEMIPPVESLFHLYKSEIAYAEKEQWEANRRLPQLGNVIFRMNSTPRAIVPIRSARC